MASSLQVWSLVAVVGERQGKLSPDGAVFAISLPVSVPPAVYVYTPEDTEREDDSLNNHCVMSHKELCNKCFKQAQ